MAILNTAKKQLAKCEAAEKKIPKGGNPDSNDICNVKKQIENEQKAENYFKTSIVGTYVIDREQLGQKNIQALTSSLYPVLTMA